MAGKTAGGWRMTLARVLVVLGVIVAIAAVVAGYVRYQALDTPTVKDKAELLIRDKEVRDQVAATLVDELFNNVDVQADLEKRLPPDQQGLAGPLSGALRELADRSAQRLLERPRFQALWVESVARTHEQLVLLLDDKTTYIRTQGGAVILDLNPLVVQLGDQIAVVGKVAERLPEDSGRIEIMDAEQLETAQDVTQLLRQLARYLWIVSLALFAVALWLARGRRRPLLRMIALGLVVAGLVVVIVRNLAGDYIVDNVVKVDANRAAAANAWDILSSLLADGGWTLVLLGVVALLAVWLAGPSRSGTASRRELAPFLARWEIAFGAAAVLFVLLEVWQPTPQTTRTPFIVAGALLLALGVELLRRQTAREYPEAAGVDLSDSMRAKFRRSGGASKVGDLERLARLHEQGLLTDEELAAEKKRLLGS